jgi:hypothetical protein
VSEALEIAIEREWLTLSTTPRQLYLTPTGRVVNAMQASRCAKVEFLGRFQRGIGLADFREEVFHVWDGMRR